MPLDAICLDSEYYLLHAASHRSSGRRAIIGDRTELLTTSRVTPKTTSHPDTVQANLLRKMLAWRLCYFLRYFASGSPFPLSAFENVEKSRFQPLK
jgi:hypothetical protein